MRRDGRGGCFQQPADNIPLNRGSAQSTKSKVSAGYSKVLKGSKCLIASFFVCLFVVVFLPNGICNRK